MSWNNLYASYGGGGYQNFFDDPVQNYRANVVLANARDGVRLPMTAGYQGPSFEEFRREYYANAGSSSDDYWERDGWVPLTKSGRQKSPNQIRNELQRYIDKCKAEGTSNQTRIIKEMGVNSNSFRKFMDPSTYRDQWSATANGTYWAAAKLLEKVAWEKELDKLSRSSSNSGRSKRKSSRYEYDSDDDGEMHTNKRYKSNSGEIKLTRDEAKLASLTLLRTITSERDMTNGVVYDTCPQLVKKIKDFLSDNHVTKSDFMLALGGINSNSLNKFLAGKRQEEAGNVTYRRAYVFFEKYRLLLGEPKSAARRRNEVEHPYGFPLHKPRNPRVLGQPYRPYGRSSSSSNSFDWLGMMGMF